MDFYNLISSNPAASWFVFGIVLIVLESLVPGVVIMWFGLGAIVAAFTTWIHWTGTFSSQLWVFIVASLVLVFLSRTIFKKFLFKPSIKTNSEALIGMVGVVVEDIGPAPRKGYVTVGNERWPAQSSEVIQKDANVVVIGFEGITLFVRRS
jgi:inner membrane protein